MRSIHVVLVALFCSLAFASFFTKSSEKEVGVTYGSDEGMIALADRMPQFTNAPSPTPRPNCGEPRFKSNFRKFRFFTRVFNMRINDVAAANFSYRQTRNKLVFIISTVNRQAGFRFAGVAVSRSRNVRRRDVPRSFFPGRQNNDVRRRINYRRIFLRPNETTCCGARVFLYFKGRICLSVGNCPQRGRFFKRIRIFLKCNRNNGNNN